MRFALASALLCCGCASMNVGFVPARPALEVDGRHRAIRVTLGSSVPDAFNLGLFPVTDWRMSVGQGFVEALRETFVVVDDPAEDVLELEVLEAFPTMVGTQKLVFAQVNYRALLKAPDGEVLARAAGVAQAPYPAGGILEVRRMATSAVEELVRVVGNKTLAAIPGLFRPTSRQGWGSWRDNLKGPRPAPAPAVAAAPAPPPRPPPAPIQHACEAESLPEWKTASAAEKKALLERCR